MKINEVIRQRRKELGLTQDRVAELLGVSAPAVNKWENGNSYPDITLLPPLARLLKTDLNTLLSFQDELTDLEVANLMNEVAEQVKTGDLEAAFEMARDRVREYPNCMTLIYGMATMIKGSVMMTQPEDAPRYKAQADDWLRLCANGENRHVRESAIVMLFSDALERKALDEARTLLDQLPEPLAVDKQQLKINLHLASGEQEKALDLMERQLLKTANNLITQLSNLMDLSWKQGQCERAERYGELSRKTAEQFDLMPYDHAIADFLLALQKKDAKTCLDALQRMLEALKQPWDPSASPLYPHIKNTNDVGSFNSLLSSSLLKELQRDEKLAFLREDPAYAEFVSRYLPPADPAQAAER